MSLGGDIGNQLIAILEQVKIDLFNNASLVTKIVNQLPASGEKGVIYLVPVASTLQTDHNIYKEYAWINAKTSASAPDNYVWEELGSTELNLNNYPTAATINSRLATKLDKDNPDGWPTKLSDLTIDEDSKFVTFKQVSSLPSISSADVNCIYLIPDTIKTTYNTSATSVTIQATDYLGTKITIKNNKNVALSVYKTEIGYEETSTAVLNVVANGTGVYTIPNNVYALRIVQSGGVNVEITWLRETADNYKKYIKVNNNGTYQWEELDNPNGVTYNYLKDNYYMKSMIYSRDEVITSIDNLVDALNGRKYYKYVWGDWTQPTLTANNTYVDGFKVQSNYDAYYPNTGDIHVHKEEEPAWIHATMQTQLPFAPSKFTFDVVRSTLKPSAASAAYSISIQGSEDGSTWVTLATADTAGVGSTVTMNISTNNSYSYFKLNTRSGGEAYNDYLTIKNLQLYGRTRTVAESTSSDYDFIVVEPPV